MSDLPVGSWFSFGMLPCAWPWAAFSCGRCVSAFHFRDGAGVLRPAAVLNNGPSVSTLRGLPHWPVANR